MMKERNAVLSIMLLTVVIVCGGITGGCSPFSNDLQEADLPDDNLQSYEKKAHWSGWVPYWDYQNGIDELMEYEGEISEIVAFAAIFSMEDARILMLNQMDEMTRLLRGLPGGDTRIYLSFTNDVQMSDGSFLQKDTRILWRLLGSDESLEAHVRQVLDTADQYSVDGIEIDYESIKKDTALWKRFQLFVDKLYHYCTQKGLKMRVVLSANDADIGGFPEGPEYVVMCYNLYGPHSGPGPKADAAFLSRTYQNNHVLPGTVIMAFANGGFDWDSNGGCRAVTQMKAQELLKLHSATAERDEGSQSLSFIYTDREGLVHEVWYADRITIEYWTDMAIQQGYNSFSLWRMGGNDRQNLPYLK